MVTVGLIGFGNRGQSLLSALQSLANVQLVAVGDVSAAARESAGLQTRAAVFDPDHESWPAAPPQLIVVATPPADRAALVERLVQPGVRIVLVEKPIALTLAECDRMQKACVKHGARLSVAHQWRYCRTVQALRSELAQGRLGQIQSVQAQCYGNLLDQGVHLLDAIRWVLGGARVLWASAHGCNDRETLTRLAPLGTPVVRDEHHPAPLWMSTTLALDGDIRVQIDAGPLLQQTAAPLGLWHERRFTVRGTHGSVECRPGHYLRWQSGDADPAEDLVLHPDSLNEASRHMLAAACESARTNGPAPVPSDDARLTLEGLLLCGASLRDSAVSEAPLRTGDNPFADVGRLRRFALARPARVSTGPRFSVLIPLVDERGFGERCLDGWLQQVDVTPDDYELLLLGPGDSPSLADRLASRLRETDRLVMAPGAGRSELYDRGAKAARGEYLVFTESHCVPETDFLHELDQYLQRTVVDGACCRSIPVCHNKLARADAALFEAGFREFRRDEDWRKVNIHAFALRRDVYNLLGGFNARYEDYSEMVLAADLRDAGIRLGYSAAAAVQHHYRLGLSEITTCVDSFVRGELRYRQDHGTVEGIGFSFLEMAGDLADNPAACQECWRLEWDRFRRGVRRGDFSALGALATVAWRWLNQGRIAQALVHLRVRTAMLRCRLAGERDERLLPAYQDLFHASVRAAWLRFRALAPQPQPAHDELQLETSQLPEDWLFGFHPIESLEGRTFRWSRPVAGIDLPLKPGDYEITVETGGIRPWPGSLRWSFCGEPIPAEQVVYGPTECRLRLTVPQHKRPSRRTLGISCQPWDVADPRALGLPIFGLGWRVASTPQDLQAVPEPQDHDASLRVGREAA